jgi:hypothetical protein
MKTFMLKRHEKDTSNLPSQRNFAFSNIAVKLPDSLPDTVLEDQDAVK